MSGLTLFFLMFYVVPALLGMACITIHTMRGMWTKEMNLLYLFFIPLVGAVITYVLMPWALIHWKRTGSLPTEEDLRETFPTWLFID